VALAPGSRLGAYEIISALGAGGMGEVYRGRDTKLNRDVAIKVLPDLFASDAERLARFTHEAQTLASLNHPHIAAIYGLEESGDVRALVMELVEGEDLSQRIARGAIPLDEALTIAKQIAEALEAAHELGIIHRDLKPANVKVRTDGTVKVLDYGLAKAVEPTGVMSPNLSMSPTITTPAMTRAGVILGTAAYMSPEQTRGKTADQRADIWAFGCVFYEMLTGKRPFDGDDVVDVLGAVARLEPDWAALSTASPLVIERLIRGCLEKDQRRRVRNVSTALFLIEGLPGEAIDPAHGRSADRPLWRRASPALLAACVAAAITGASVWAIKPSAPMLVMRSRLVLPAGQQFTTDSQVVAISSDGTQLVYVANQRLFLRLFSELEARPIQGSDGPSTGLSGISSPVFSPDGQSIAYWDQGSIKRIVVGGGTAVTLCHSARLWGMSWSGDEIVYGEGSQGIMRVSAGGGMPEQIARVESTELAASPQMLPGNRAVLFTTLAPGAGIEQWDTASIVVQALGSGERKTIVERGSHARYLSSGHIVYVLDGVLFAAPFDERRLQVTGRAVPVVNGVRRGNFGNTSAKYSVSDSGSLVFVPGPVSMSDALRGVVRMNRKGGVEQLPLPPNVYSSIRVSPDGRQLAFGTDNGKEAIVWVYDLSRTSGPRRLTFGGGNRFPIWSGDGQRVVFQSDREGDPGVYWQRADGTGTAQRLTTPDHGTAHIPESWSAADDGFSFSAVAGSNVSLWTFSMSEKKAVPFGDLRSTAPFNSEFSPDGRWLAYTLRTANSANVYVEPSPVTGAKYQITTENGHHPVWLSDGKGLSYRVSGSQQVVVSVNTTPSFSIGNPGPAIAGGLPTVVSIGSRSYDITPDGTAFLTVSPLSGPQPGSVETQEIQIVQNWLEELKRLVPTR
jgi:eukaryotic-like serine/threonine-protein kinase